MSAAKSDSKASASLFAVASAEAPVVLAAVAQRSIPDTLVATATPQTGSERCSLANFRTHSCDCHLLAGIKDWRLDRAIYHQAINSVYPEPDKVRTCD